MSNQIENKIDEYLVWPDNLSVSDNEDIQYLQDLSTAEIGVYNIAFDEERRKALFSYDPNKEFVVEFEEYTCHVNLDWYIQIYTNQISKQQNPSPNAPVYCYSYSKSLFCNCSPRWDGSTPAYLTSLPRNIIRSSKFGLFFPMLYLMALRFSVLEGKRYSIEMVAEELFANKLVTRQDFLSSMKFSG